MPIKPENKKLYPADWPQIRERIRSRAKDKCENCGVHDHSVGYRDEEGNFIPCSGNLIMEDYGSGIDPHTGSILEVRKAKEMAEFQTQNDEMGNKYIVIICTTAHLDHNPANCDESNLRFWCQKCHNSYDVRHRKKTRRNTRMKNQLKIPDFCS